MYRGDYFHEMTRSVKLGFVELQVGAVCAVLGELLGGSVTVLLHIAHLLSWCILAAGAQ